MRLNQYIILQKVIYSIALCVFLLCSCSTLRSQNRSNEICILTISQEILDDYQNFIYKITEKEITIYEDLGNDTLVRYSKELTSQNIDSLIEVIHPLYKIKEHYQEEMIDGLRTEVNIFKGNKIYKRIFIENTYVYEVDVLIKYLNQLILLDKYDLRDL